MKQICAFIIALGVLGSGCASLGHTPITVLDLIHDAQWGIVEACSMEWLPQDACTIGLDALTLAAGIATHSGSDVRTAVRQSLLDAEMKLPASSRLRPYLDALIAALTPLP